MYKIKEEYIYYYADELKKFYLLNCSTNDVIEIDSTGALLIKELLETKNKTRANEILELFEGWDLFEKRDS